MYTTQAVRRASDPATLQQRLASAAGRVLAATSNLDRQQKQLLRDIRGLKYPYRSLTSFAEATALCPDDAIALAVAEEIRGFILERRATPSIGILDALRAEEAANWRENEAALAFVNDRSPARKAALTEALLGQMETSRVALDVLHAAPRVASLSLVR